MLLKIKDVDPSGYRVEMFIDDNNQLVGFSICDMSVKERALNKSIQV